MRAPRLLLLDVNVLVALAWRTHQFHDAATARLSREPRRRWASCALTQLGFLRVSCNPAVTGVRQSAATCLALLSAMVADRHHVFLDELPPADSAAPFFPGIVGHQQVTDAYLLAVAHRVGAALVTFDRRVAAVAGHRVAVEVLP